jgi:uncharacterized repeat protein (TIGR01451 family)
VPGAESTYGITVTNAGPDTATGVTLLVTLPSGLSFRGHVGEWSCAIDPAVQPAGQVARCALAESLPVGAAPALWIRVAAAPGITGPVDLTAAVSSAAADEGTAPNSDLDQRAVAGAGGSLPRTGGAFTSRLGLALGMVALGAVLIALTRRRAASEQ